MASSSSSLGSPQLGRDAAAKSPQHFGKAPQGGTADLHLDSRLKTFKIDPELFWDICGRPEEQLVIELHTISYSHYNEKARWMLQAAGIRYAECGNLAFLHTFAMAKLQKEFKQKGSRDKTSSPLSTPALAIYSRRNDEQGGKGSPLLLLPDSSLICRFAEVRFLGKHGRPMPILGYTNPPSSLLQTWVRPLPSPGIENPDSSRAWEGMSLRERYQEDPEIAAFEKLFHDKLGPPLRAVYYSHILPRPWLYAAVIFNNSTSIWKALLHMAFYPLIALLLVLAFKITPSNVARCEGVIREVFDSASRSLSKHQVQGSTAPRYLTGSTKPTQADLCFAALGGLLVGAEEYGGIYPNGESAPCWFPAVALLPSGFQRFVKELRATPAGRLTVDLYSRYRRSGCAVDAVNAISKGAAGPASPAR